MTDSALPYDALLDSAAWLRRPRAITLLSGERGCGKTTACLRIITAAQADGIDVRGLVTPGRYAADGTRIGIDLVDPATGARWPLAERIAPRPATGRQWRFDPAGLAQGRRLLEASQECDLLVIDEIGPLELEEGGGWVVALDVLRAEGYRQALVVVRPSLRDVLIARLPTQTIHTIVLPAGPA